MFDSSLSAPTFWPLRALLTNLSYFCFAEVSESVFKNFKCLVLFVGLTLLSASSLSFSSSSVFFLYGPLVT